MKNLHIAICVFAIGTTGCATNRVTGSAAPHVKVNARSSVSDIRKSIALLFQIGRHWRWIGDPFRLAKMTSAILISLIGLFTTVCVALARPPVDDGLLIAARKALPQNISTNEIVRALGTGLWNSNRTAVAIAIAKPKASVLFVFLRQPGAKYLAVDVSGMEGANFGYLGTAGRAGYDRFETTPLKWLHRDDALFQVQMRTRAWKLGQRYTAAGTLIIKPDGTCLWQ
jgi:hypothetical protein